MNTVNYNNNGAITDASYLGVDNNRLVVTNRPRNPGTFNVTTTDAYTALPANRATSFRLNNYTGKMVGIRRRHKKIVIDDFNDQDNSEWNTENGEMSYATAIEGKSAVSITGTVTKPFDHQITHGSEIHVSLITPHDGASSVSIYDNDGRPADESAFSINLNNYITPGSFAKLIIKLEVDDSLASCYIENINGERSTAFEGVAGIFGSGDMTFSVISITSENELTVDPIILFSRVYNPQEILISSSSFNFPCDEYLSEYEVVNLGSDPMNYSDNTDTIVLTGLYAT